MYEVMVDDEAVRITVQNRGYEYGINLFWNREWSIEDVEEAIDTVLYEKAPTDVIGIWKNRLRKR